jgi:bidirectional [NiFe] hydrogenase diaphorase subunit
MAEMIQVTVNGKTIEVPYDTQLLQACREAGADVPTMCHNENLPAYGVCRICSVEINEGRRWTVVPSCVYTVRKNVEVKTDTEKLTKHRAMLLNLMLARCPEDKVVQELAAEYGVTAPHERFLQAASGDSDCILCGLCVQTCQEIVGVAALGYEGRGANRRVVPAFDKENPVCVVCGACSYICPTQCIDFAEIGGKRIMKRWHREVDMLVCDKCGKNWLPEPFEHVFKKRMGIDPAIFKHCPDCR